MLQGPYNYMKMLVDVPTIPRFMISTHKPHLLVLHLATTPKTTIVLELILHAMLVVFVVSGSYFYLVDTSR
jgi:hypothetical protein